MVKGKYILVTHATMNDYEWKADEKERRALSALFQSAVERKKRRKNVDYNANLCWKISVDILWRGALKTNPEARKINAP